MKGIKLKINEKEYILGFANRGSIRRAENLGLNLMDRKVITFSDKLFYASLIDRQPDITEEEADELIGKLKENGYDYAEIITTLRQLLDEVFISTQIKDPKKKKTIKIEDC